MNVVNGASRITRCIFRNNSLARANGAALYLAGSSSHIIGINKTDQKRKKNLKINIIFFFILHHRGKFLSK